MAFRPSAAGPNKFLQKKYGRDPAVGANHALASHADGCSSTDDRFHLVRGRPMPADASERAFGPGMGSAGTVLLAMARCRQGRRQKSGSDVSCGGPIGRSCPGSDRCRSDTLALLGRGDMRGVHRGCPRGRGSARRRGPPGALRPLSRARRGRRARGAGQHAPAIGHRVSEGPSARFVSSAPSARFYRRWSG
jgi:hypothetical protein